MKERNVMIDIETLGTKRDSLVFSICCVEFDSKFNVLSNYYKTISIESLLNAGLVIDTNTLNWWISTDKELFLKLISNVNLVDVKEALIGFETYLLTIEKKCKDYEIWTKSPSFDCVILTELFERILGTSNKKIIESKFRDYRDVRTAISIADSISGKNTYSEFKNTNKNEYHSHNAYDDCVKQIESLKYSLKQI